jgi:hypothetical protein
MASQSVRHQVFVSSTFTDLKEERAEVIQAIWELDCIPTGMEAFVASNESQWDVIKRVIHECDYYVLIIGGRYGTVTADGISYTEKKYLYARERGIPVLAFVHGAPEEITVGKTEKDEKQREKLNKFRESVLRDYPVRHWSSAAELGGIVSRSLVREIKNTPRPGWIRNDGVSPLPLLEKINALTEENQNLRQELSRIDYAESDPNLEQGSDEIELFGTRRLRSRVNAEYWDAEWHCLNTWDGIFADIGPALINEAKEEELKQILTKYHVLDPLQENCDLRGFVTVAPETWNDILIQFRALGYLGPGEKKRGVNDNSRYWKITPLGDRHLVSLLARKRKA